MDSIYRLQERADEMRRRTETDSITPEDVGGLHADTLAYIAGMEQNLTGLGVRKVYRSAGEMEADTAPEGADGKPLRHGQLAAIYDADDPTADGSGDIYAWRNPGWEKAGNLGTELCAKAADEARAAAKKAEEAAGKALEHIDAYEAKNEEQDKRLDALEAAETAAGASGLPLIEIKAADAVAGDYATEQTTSLKSADEGCKVVYIHKETGGTPRLMLYHMDAKTGDTSYFPDWADADEFGVKDADGAVTPFSRGLYLNSSDGALYRFDGGSFAQVTRTMSEGAPRVLPFDGFDIPARGGSAWIWNAETGEFYDPVGVWNGKAGYPAEEYNSTEEHDSDRTNKLFVYKGKIYVFRNEELVEYCVNETAEAETERQTAEAARVAAEKARAEAETARETASAKAVSDCEAATTAAEKVNVSYADGKMTVTDRTGATKTADLAEAATVGERLTKVEEAVEKVSGGSYCEVICSEDTTLYVDDKAVEVKGGVKTKLYPTTEFSATGNTALIRFDGTHLDVSKFTSFYRMFDYCTRLSSFVGYENWVTSNVTDMRLMFRGCSSLAQPLDFSGWDVSGVTNDNFDSMLQECAAVTSYNFAGWNVSEARYFPDAAMTNAETVNVTGMNTAGVTSLQGKFCAPRARTIYGIASLDTSSVTSVRQAFNGCKALEELDLSGWDMSACADFGDMFANCYALTSLKLGEGFGKMPDAAGEVDFGWLTAWTQNVNTLLDLYDRKANNMGGITLKLSAATKNALGTANIEKLTAKGYTIS